MDDWTFELDQQLPKIFNKQNPNHLTAPGSYLEWLDQCEIVAIAVVGKKEWRRYTEPFLRSVRSPRRDRLYTLEYRISHPSYYTYQDRATLCTTGLFHRRLRRSLGSKILANSTMPLLLGGFLTLEDRISIYIDVLAVDMFLEMYMDDLVQYRRAYHNTDSETQAVRIKREWISKAAEEWFNRIDLSAVEPHIYESIDKDLNRTIPSSVRLNTYEGLSALRSVLTCISLLFPCIGYCQSMNYIAAFMLTIFDYHIPLTTVCMAQMLRPSSGEYTLEGHPIFPVKMIEDRVVCQAETIGLKNLDMFGTDLSGTKRNMDVLNSLIKYLFPDISAHLKNIDHPNMDIWLMKSVMTAFVNSFLAPLSVCHVWDLLLLGSIYIPGGALTMNLNLHLLVIMMLKNDILASKSLDDLDSVFKSRKLVDNCCIMIERICTKPPVPFEIIFKYIHKANECPHVNYKIANIVPDLTQFGLYTKPSKLPLREYTGFK